MKTREPRFPRNRTRVHRGTSRGMAIKKRARSTITPLSRSPNSCLLIVSNIHLVKRNGRRSCPRRTIWSSRIRFPYTPLDFSEIVTFPQVRIHQATTMHFSRSISISRYCIFFFCIPLLFNEKFHRDIFIYSWIRNKYFIL